MGVMTSPLALISIGATFRGREALAKIKPTLGASFIKLIGLAAIFMPLAIYMGFRDQKLIALLIMLASPCTPTSYIMAKTWMAMQSLPLVLWSQPQFCQR